jgi:glycosyltransferase involved in cell wall biosynthesis
MKITIVTGFFLPVPPVLGGATEKIWHRLAAELARAGNEVTFISRAWPGFPSCEKDNGVRHLRIKGADHTRSLVVNLWHDFWWGVRVARSLPPADVVICNSPILPAWLGSVRPAAGKVVAVVARMPKGQSRFYGRVDRVLVLSEAVAAQVRAENPRLASRLAAFPFPIDWTMHAGKSAQAAPGVPLTIGYVGRIHPEKGLDLLLQAATKLAARTDLPLWRLEITGPAEVTAGGGGEAYRDRLVREFGAALGERLVFLSPEFNPAVLAETYGRTDIFCYPSLAERGETFGVAVAEAMASGAAPVVSGLACFRDLVRHGENGLTFDQRSPDAATQLAEAIARLASDPAARRTMAARAQNFVRRFDFAASATSLAAELATLAPRSK